MKNVIHGNNLTILKTLETSSIDSIVTDPPYGINFLGKDWDANTGTLETYEECLRVLKPGGHLLAFSAARTYHHLAITLEQAGFEIRDQLMWLYASGFPKAQQIKTAPGWKTALKPAHEPIVMARKPFKGSTTNNVIEHGVGALNIDASRIPYEDSKDLDTYLNNVAGPMERSTAKAGDGLSMFESKTGFKAQKGKVNRPSAGNRTSSFHNATEGGETQSGGDGSGGWTHNDAGRFPSNVLGEVEGYQKYFYCPKVSRKERHIGFEQLPEPEPFNNPAEIEKHPLWDSSIGTNSHRLTEKIRKHQAVGNNHPTVKPVALMEYLITLVTPKEGTVLDPFMGSGSTGMAACGLGYNFIGIDLDSHYCQIAETRIEAWCKDNSNNNFNNLFE